MVVEVAPGQLAAERVGQLALLELARRDAAEVQVGRQARGLLRVARGRTGGERGGAVARLGLAAARRVGGVGRQAERVQRRDAALAHAGGQRRQRARRAQHRATRRGQPGAVKGGEDDVGLARLGAQRADVVDGEQAGAGLQRRARVRERRAHSLRAGARERAGVGAAVHGGRRRCRGPAGQLRPRAARAGRRDRRRARAARRRGHAGRRAGTASAARSRAVRAAGGHRGRRPARRGRARPGPRAAAGGRARAGRA